MTAASRGWARFIETHFPLQAARVVWQNRAIPAFLVSACTREAFNPQSNSSWRWIQPGIHGYYLFDEELRWGKLVAKDWGRCLDNLKVHPPIFDGQKVLERESEAVGRQLQGEAQNCGASMSNGFTARTGGNSGWRR